MTTPLSSPDRPAVAGSIAERAPTDLQDSLDIRFIVAGTLSRTAVHVRRERAEFAAALDPQRPRPGNLTTSDPDRSPR
jgi:hypothetical protein